MSREDEYVTSEMDCPYAVRDDYYKGSYITKCDCPGGCPYKKETSDDEDGIIGECTKIFNFLNSGEFKKIW